MKKSDGSDMPHLGDEAVISSRFHDTDAALGLGRCSVAAFFPGGKPRDGTIGRSTTCMKFGNGLTRLVLFTLSDIFRLKRIN
jgi:hypothetical protein